MNLTPLPLILLTNDDGYRAPGLAALQESLSSLGRVMTVAPSTERSAVSHGLTLHTPLRIHEIRPDWHAVDGTPADCVLVALNHMLERPPDMVVSGINAGANLGDDIMYSGTVAAAREGSLYGIPSVAFSLCFQDEMDYLSAARQAESLCRRILDAPPPPGVFLNINFPGPDPAGIMITRQSSKNGGAGVHAKLDPRGRAYYWIGEDEGNWIAAADTDLDAVQRGYVSITPLQRDQTAHADLERLRRLFPTTE